MDRLTYTLGSSGPIEMVLFFGWVHIGFVKSFDRNTNLCEAAAASRVSCCIVSAKFSKERV